jgi:hypothetical protein
MHVVQKQIKFPSKSGEKEIMGDKNNEEIK